MFLLAWKIVGFYILDILLDSTGDLLVEAEIAAEEAGLEFGIDTEQVVHDQDLAVAMSACADADGGDLDALRDCLAKGGGYLFEIGRASCRERVLMPV